MKIRTLKINKTWEGFPLLEITLPKSEYRSLEPFLSLSDRDIPKYELNIVKTKNKRSLDANSFCWLLIGKLAAVLGKKNTDIYREYIKETSAFEIIPVKEDKIEHWERIWGSHGVGWLCEDLGECRNTKGYHNIKSYYGSSVYDSKEMSHLIDMIVEDCKAQGIETETPEEIERLKEMWK